MTSRGRSRVSTWVALAAAYLVLVQAVLGVPPDQRPAFDAFAVLCGHAVPDHTPEAPARSHHDGRCCLAACAGGIAILPSGPAIAAAARAPKASSALRPVAADPGDRRPRGAPPAIRGPPETA